MLVSSCCRYIPLVILTLCLLASCVSCATHSVEPEIESMTNHEPDVTSPYIIGEDWNNMTLSQKTRWVDIALTAMVMGGELHESEKQPAIYYVDKLDELFYEPANSTKLVAWELTAFTSGIEEAEPEAPDLLDESTQVSKPPIASEPESEPEPTSEDMDISYDDWELMDSGISNYHLRGVCGFSSSDVFAVGGAGTIIHFDGDEWTQMNSGTENTLRGIYSCNAGLVAGGWKGTVLVYDSGTWLPIDCGTNYDMYNVGGTSSEVFIVGSEVNVIRYDGDICSLLDTGATRHLYGVWGDNSEDVFVVGNSGIVLHYDGEDWVTMDSGTNNNIHGVWGFSSNDVFAVGDDGTIIHYDGHRWEPMDSHTSNTLRGVWGITTEDVFCVGTSGTILHYDGDNWVRLDDAYNEVKQLPADNQILWAIWGNESDIFVVGNYGTVLHCKLQ